MKLETPEAVGFSAERLARINAVMQAYVDKQKLPGLITLLARHGKVVHFERLGQMDMEANKLMQADAIFRIASMTKPIATVAAMMLYEEGDFQLSDPVSKFIDGFSDLKVNVGNAAENEVLVDLDREVTMHDLLIHTSGVVYDFDYNKTLEENILELVKMPLGHQPGARWQYSQSTSVLAYIVELLSGTSFDRFLEDRIFKPLQMNDTAYHVPEDKGDRLTALYGPTETGELELIESPQSSEYAKPRRLYSGSSGLVSTAVDYFRFSQMLLNGGQLDGVRILGPRTVDFMFINHIPRRLLPLHLGDWVLAGMGFGLGGYIISNPAEAQVLESLGNFGWGGAYSTNFWIDRQEDIVCLLMTQLEPFGFYPLQEQLKVLTYQALVD